MFCPQCGNSVDSSMNFCPYCSYSLKNIKKSNQAENTNDSSSYSKSTTNDYNNYNDGKRQGGTPSYQQEQNLPSFERYRQKIAQDSNSNYNNQKQTNSPTDYQDQQEYNPFYNPYNDGNNEDSFNANINENVRPNRGQNSQNDFFDYPQSGYSNNINRSNYNQEDFDSKNLSQSEFKDARNDNQNNYYNKTQYQEPRYNQNTSNQRQQESADISSGGNFGKNIYSSKNQRNADQSRQGRQASPLLPPDEYQPEETYKKGRERNLEPTYDEEDDMYDYEQRQSSQPRFYNKGWFIALMIILVLLSAAVLMHFLNIIDLTKIPQYVDDIINKESTAEESSLEESQNSLAESSQDESSKESSAEEESSNNSSIEASGINDKKFYIDAKDIEQKHKDKVFKLDDPIEIEGVTYTISIDDNENIKSESDEYVIINLAIANSSGKTLLVNPFYFTLVDEGSNIYYPSFKDSSSIPIEEVETNKKLNGKISYKVPKGLTTLYIAFSNSENLDLADFFIKYR